MPVAMAGIRSQANGRQRFRELLREQVEDALRFSRHHASMASICPCAQEQRREPDGSSRAKGLEHIICGPNLASVGGVPRVGDCSIESRALAFAQFVTLSSTTRSRTVPSGSCVGRR